MGANGNSLLKHGIKNILLRNCYLLDGNRAKRNRINIEFWSEKINVGDQISKPIVEWMLREKNIKLDQEVNGTKHLMGLGSIIGLGHFDAVIWGSGIHMPTSVYRLGRWRNIIRYDVRAVRGPLTKAALESFGYDCSKCVFGDPGIIMPLIYNPNIARKKYVVSIINHFKNRNIGEHMLQGENCHYIDVETSDYKFFIDEILSSKIIISSSLHGIILAESYGIPAIFLNNAGVMDREIIKYYDWYYSTNRRSINCAYSLEEALNMKPMPLPDLHEMRHKLINSFPFDLWNY